MSAQEPTPPEAVPPGAGMPPVAAPTPNGVGAAAARAAPPAPAGTDGVAPRSGAAPPAGGGPPAAAAKPRRSVRRIVLPSLGVVLVGGLLYVANVYRTSVLYVATDNAQLTRQPVQVGAMNAGRVATINASVGMAVRKGDVLAQVQLPSQVGTVQNGTPKMDFLGPGDTRVDVTAPIDGVVIAIPSAIGGTVAAGQPVVTLSDPSQVWVNANIEETKVDRLRLGQVVDVYLDALHTTVPGRVEAITPATAAIFSLLPANSTSGSFTKVTQLVPVRIAVDLGTQPTLIGSSVEVKIHVR